ncbi:hypothetical protein RND71_003432 [Anisodus tanguticus]|uniref:Uncharacterized protein n=1 Tax=Anisodus tanguticus TaxID=243964 RepID=A0AAE1SYM1_9SOLA|nr:hypothetical protein RND71_003432 [Anisodus tanguticus]
MERPCLSICVEVFLDQVYMSTEIFISVFFPNRSRSLLSVKIAAVWEFPTETVFFPLILLPFLVFFFWSRCLCSWMIQLNEIPDGLVTPDKYSSQNSILDLWTAT